MRLWQAIVREFADSDIVSMQEALDIMIQVLFSMDPEKVLEIAKEVEPRCRAKYKVSDHPHNDPKRFSGPLYSSMKSKMHQHFLDNKQLVNDEYDTAFVPKLYEELLQKEREGC